MTKKGRKRIGIWGIMVVVGVGMLVANLSTAGEIYLREGERLVAQDTIPLKAYQAVVYAKCDSEGHRTWMGNVIIIYKDKKEVMSIDEGGSEIANICALMTPESAGYVMIPEYDPDGALTSYSYVKKSDTCYIGDINADTVDEIIIESYSGGAHCCFSTWIFAVKDSLELLLKIDGCEFGDDIVDLNKDSIPEILTWDNGWVSWRSENTQYTAFIPLLIFSWDKNKYRIANIKFKDYLIKKNNLDRYKINASDSTKEQFECDEYNLWSFMIDNYYIGRADLADSIYNACWPAQDTMKLKIYQEFQQRLRRSEYWPQVLESNW